MGGAGCSVRRTLKPKLRRPCPHPRFDLRPGGLLRDSNFVVRLESQPDFGRHTEVLSEAQCGIRRNRTLSPDDFADAIGRYVYLPSERVDTQIQRFHEFLA